MKQIAFALMLLALPVRAEVSPTLPAPGTDGMQQGQDLLQQGMQSILEGLFTQMQPAINDMSRALTEMRPMAEQLMQMMDNIGNYQAPEVQPNGDILIRRKPPVVTPPKEGEIDL